MRVALGVEYDGTDFSGWQSQQPGVRTVQTTLQRALSAIAAHPVTISCAGRTDRGVHAAAQVVHFDTDSIRDQRAWVLGGNARLPDDVSVAWARPVGDDFHARFSAVARRYRYRILNRPARSALKRRDRTLYYRGALDAGRMHAAAQTLLGERDFSAFRAAACQSATPWRCVTELSVVRRDDEIIVEIEANAFLHHMVRNIVGSLFEVGSGERPPEWLAELLASRDRRRAGVTAPPQGLCLTAVRYPETLLPADAAAAGLRFSPAPACRRGARVSG